ncbi:MAG: DUF4382 domain-containing protein [Herminiimonas sp.]|nr:DUF4382 domain-containing protein [Herminiimonas sp.]
MIISKPKLLLLSALASAGLLSACGGGGGGTDPASTQAGTVHFTLTDAPACGFDAVNVTVAKVRVHQSATASDTDAGWTDVTLNPARKINLLTLTNGVLSDLGQAPLAAGHYTQTRLVLVGNTSAAPFANSVVPTGGTETTLDTPSAVQSGIKLNHEFDVAPGALADFTLDFDACKSIVTRGNGSYGLKPVITVIPTVVSGAINGVIGVVPSTSRPVVSAQLNGVVIKSTVPDASGAFSLSPLAQTAAGAGYTVVVTADGFATDVVTGVPVTAKTNTVVSTSGSPLALSASGMNRISGSVLPIIAQGSVRAIQTYASAAPTSVTVKFQGADLLTGAYGMSLPTGAAMLGAFGTGALPVVLAAQTASAGSYGVEASAVGFTTQSTPVSILTNSVVTNFTLK